jgi:lycopene beta-cyclase
MNGRDSDIIIVGGGLAGGLLALAFAQARPDLSLLLIEQGATLGGNHLWSFFASDIAPEDEWLVEPLIVARWDRGYSVRFPRTSRQLSTPYRTITSERLDEVVRAALADGAVRCGVEVSSVEQTRVTLANGSVLTAGGVIDARGATGMPGMRGGWQKFMGQMLRLSAPHGLTRPVVMDARVSQLDGYRFVYCLPFSPTEIFVEDTYYSDSPALDLQELDQRIGSYCQMHGWQVSTVLREESGVLPVIAAGNFAHFWPDPGNSPARAGARAGLLHPLTSFSLPLAVRLAIDLANLPEVTGAALAAASYRHARAHWRRGGFYRMLSTMLFGAASPKRRYKVLERFYLLPPGLIERFYAGRSSWADRARILIGRPPVRIGAALASLAGKGRPLARLDDPGQTAPGAPR